EEMCDWFHQKDFWLIADVSPVTLDVFGEDSLISLASRLHLDSLRLDFGFNLEEIKQNNPSLSFSYNASTILEEKSVEKNALYMHNFYPRPETALDDSFFCSLNEKIKKNEGRITAFIVGDKEKRGPIYEGLPTLEKHRYASPYAQYVDLLENYSVDQVFLGDLELSDFEFDLIMAYLKDQKIRIPVTFNEKNINLYHQLFTVRVDSPSSLIRVQESREDAQQGPAIKKKNIRERVKGSVTMDNENYLRYSGEVQITKADYPKDDKVNVIGQVKEYYHLLLDNLHNGEKFIFVPVK
ncbi:MAG: MupG family TIM beta-alpha barrel fold protein, partial [Atopostipes sp.]|nr:MupG family TIM beta-alpha barrel fold protein [Atopostipes sp.]